MMHNGWKVMMLMMILSCNWLGALDTLVAQEREQVRDYPWLWQDFWLQEEPAIYELLALPVRILTEDEVALLVAIGDRLSVLRREGKLHMPGGMWQEDLLVNQLNQLLYLSEEELAALSQEFAKEQWSSQSPAFMEIMIPALQKYFDWDVTTITSEEVLVQELATIMWPTQWLSQSFSSRSEMQAAMDQQQRWQALLAEESPALRAFFAQGTQEMFMKMSGSMLYYWLYTPDALWPIYSRNDAIRLIYTFYVGFYEALDLMSTHYWESYNAYLSSLAWQGEELNAYRLLLAENWKSLMSLFYDASKERSYLQQRNRWVFGNKRQEVISYQELLMQGYAWFLADEATKTKAQARYRYEMWGEEEETLDTVTEENTLEEDLIRRESEDLLLDLDAVDENAE